MSARRTGAATTPMAERLARSFRRIPAEDTPRLFRLRLGEIELNPDQPRKHTDEAALRELAQSIEQYGLIQPITVKRLPEAERYLLVAGERRFRAHQLLGRDEILAVITAGSPDEISLIENIQRENLHPLEEAAAYERMMERHGWTQEELAQAVGKARPTITNILKLNRLPQAIRAESLALGGNGPSKSVLFEIARLDDQPTQLTLWRKMRAGGTVRAARRGSSEHSATPTSPRSLDGTIAVGRRFLRGLYEAALEVPNGDETRRQEFLRLCADIESALRQLKSSSNSRDNQS